jgi:hypothetical protein
MAGGGTLRYLSARSGDDVEQLTIVPANAEAKALNSSAVGSRRDLAHDSRPLLLIASNFQHAPGG